MKHRWLLFTGLAVTFVKQCGARIIAPTLAREICRVWLTTGFAGGEAYLQLVSKTRAAVTKGEVRTVSEGLTKTDVWINEYDSTLQVVAQNGEIKGDKNVKLKIKSWREVYRIIR